MGAGAREDLELLNQFTRFPRSDAKPVNQRRYCVATQITTQLPRASFFRFIRFNNDEFNRIGSPLNPFCDALLLHQAEDLLKAGAL